MSLSSQERKELAKIIVRAFDKEGNPLPEAEKKDLKRAEELLGRFEPDPDIGVNPPIQIKTYKHSPEAQALIAQGAEFVGIELRNHGTEEKPMPVLREWLYVGKKPDRMATFVQDGKIIQAGPTIAAAACKLFARNYRSVVQ